MQFPDIAAEDQARIRTVLDNYDLGTVTTVRFHSGTAAKTWRVSTDCGDFILRTRGMRTSAEDLVRFDHALRRHLLDHGVPTATPLATKDGTLMVRLQDQALELYPLIPGHCVARLEDHHVAAAARMLARFHHATRTFPLAQSLPPVSQYRTLGFPKARSRMEDPQLLHRIYTRLASATDAGDFGNALGTAQTWLERLQKDLDQATYDDLPHTVTHGDYTPANILFRDGEVTGVFDFDWARWAPRVRDLADGLFFVSGTRRTPLVPGDIWSLTEAVDLTVSRAVHWLRSYHAVSAIAPEEVAALPLALAARWLSVRVEGTAKVPAGERMRFALGNLPAPLDWLDAHWPEVAAAFASPV